MPTICTGSTSVPFGASLKIGYRLNGSTNPYTYVAHTPTSNELPYNFFVPTSGDYQVEYSTLCVICTGSQFSDPETTYVTVP